MIHIFPLSDFALLGVGLPYFRACARVLLLSVSYIFQSVLRIHFSIFWLNFVCSSPIFSISD